MVLGSFRGRSVLLLSHMVGQGPAVPAADAGRGTVFIFFSSRLSYLPFLIPRLFGGGWTSEILWSRLLSPSGSYQLLPEVCSLSTG